MDKALTRAIVTQRIEAVFEEVYANHNPYAHEYKMYILEQCGKLYRVKKTLWGSKPEYKSGWLKLNEAQAILKLMEASEDGNS